MTSTNALTKRYCAQQGWDCQTVQTFYGGQRHDLFGLWDSLILHPAGFLFVQNCSYGTLKKHRDSIERSPHLTYFDRQAVQVALWEYRRKKVGRKKLWFRRSQERAHAAWGQVSAWEGPLDL